MTQKPQSFPFVIESSQLAFKKTADHNVLFIIALFDKAAPIAANRRNQLSGRIASLTRIKKAQLMFGFCVLIPMVGSRPIKYLFRNFYLLSFTRITS